MSWDKDAIKLWRHSNGTYYIVWYEKSEIGKSYRTKTKRLSTRTSDRKIAEQQRVQFIAGLNNPAPPPEPTVGYLLDRYYAEHGINTRSPSTIEYHLKSLKPFFGDLLPSQISNQLLKQFAAAKKELAAGTILRQIRTLKAALCFAEGNRWIEPLPAFRMPLPSPPPRDRWLKREEVALLLEKAKSPHIRLFIKLALTTAARSGAILELRWDQVDFEERVVDFGKGWGKKRRAIVPMHDDIYEAFWEAKCIAKSDNVIEFNGKKIKCIRISFTRLCKECGIKASPHILRHTAATWMVIEGVPVAEVARLLGNSEQMVEQVYGKHTPDYLRRAVSVLGFKSPKVLQV